MLLSGRPALPPGKTNSPERKVAIFSMIVRAASDSGTRCSLPAFMRSAATVQQPDTNASE
jgi:hypothetical protein